MSPTPERSASNEALTANSAGSESAGEPDDPAVEETKEPRTAPLPLSREETERLIKQVGFTSRQSSC